MNTLREPPFRLDTDRLIIRDMSLKDEDAFVAISQNPKYQRFYSEEDCRPEKYRQLTRLFVEQTSETPRKNYQLAVVLKETNCLIGTACLRVEEEGQASMGCGLAIEYQGRNLIQKAAFALAEFGFRDLGLHRIYAETISENRAAIRLCTQLGMQKEAHLRQNRYFRNRWWDTVILSVLRDEWTGISGSRTGAEE